MAMFVCHEDAAVGNYRDWTCCGCHVHSRATTKREHREKEIENIENCTECHWDRREHKQDTP